MSEEKSYKKSLSANIVGFVLGGIAIAIGVGLIFISGKEAAEAVSSGVSSAGASSPGAGAGAAIAGSMGLVLVYALIAMGAIMAAGLGMPSLIIGLVNLRSENKTVRIMSIINTCIGALTITWALLKLILLFNGKA